VFNVATFDNNDNVQNVARSKAVGEPPLMLAIAVWAAVKNALFNFAPGATSDLKLPATGEEILRCLTALEPQRQTLRMPATMVK
jgi:xanthine dehydrogenase large subunit